MANKKMLKTSSFKNLTRKLSYSSIFSVLCLDLKNVFFGKIQWAPSEVLEVKGHFCCFVFRGRLTSVTLATSKGAQGFLSKITFLKSVRSNEKDKVCHSFLVQIFTKSLHRGRVACWIESPFFEFWLIILSAIQNF